MIKKTILYLFFLAITCSSFGQIIVNGRYATLRGTDIPRYKMSHVVMSLLPFMGNMRTWLQQQKDDGFNVIWAHCDGYYTPDIYTAGLASLMDTAQVVGGIQIMPGFAMFNSGSVAQMFADMWNKPALFRINGKRVFAGWDYRAQAGSFSQLTLDSILNVQGIHKSDYYLIPHSRIPYSFDGGSTWVGQGAINGLPYWNGSSSFGYPGVTTDMNHLYDGWPFVDGLINFAVDQDSASIKNWNAHIAQVGRARNKFSIAGISAFYASASFHDFGFSGVAQVYDSLLSLAIRPDGISYTTANDFAELSYMTSMPNVSNGLSYVKPSGSFLANNIRVPMLDHSGLVKFLKPWDDAFLNNLPSPYFSQDRIFAWYWLHPANAATIPTIPSNVAALGSEYTQSWWNGTVYATGAIDVGGANQVTGIISNFATQIGKIRMAAHLTAPAYLRITINGTDYTSPLRSAGVAYWECAQALGTPVFSIISADGTTVRKTGSGQQAITSSCYPGGWNPMVTEIP